jgi:hypothetical protein
LRPTETIVKYFCFTFATHFPFDTMLYPQICNRTPPVQLAGIKHFAGVCMPVSGWEVANTYFTNSTAMSILRDCLLWPQAFGIRVRKAEHHRHETQQTVFHINFPSLYSYRAKYVSIVTKQIRTETQNIPLQTYIIMQCPNWNNRLRWKQTQSADHGHVIGRNHVRGQSLPLAMNPAFNMYIQHKVLQYNQTPKMRFIWD